MLLAFCFTSSILLFKIIDGERLHRSLPSIWPCIATMTTNERPPESRLYPTLVAPQAPQSQLSLERTYRLKRESGLRHQARQQSLLEQNFKRWGQRKALMMAYSILGVVQVQALRCSVLFCVRNAFRKKWKGDEEGRLRESDDQPSSIRLLAISLLATTLHNCHPGQTNLRACFRVSSSRGYLCRSVSRFVSPPVRTHL